MRAALYIRGRIVTGNSHLDAYQRLDPEEKEDQLTSGFFDSETGEFQTDLSKEHFYDKKILLIRHGKVIQNKDDPPLSDNGIEEIRSMSKYLSQFDLTNFIGFTSPLLRCLQTTRIISKLTKIPFVVDPEIAETSQNFDIKNRNEEFEEFKWPTTKDLRFNFESASEFLNRVANVLKKLPKRCILISHSGFITNTAKLALCDEKIKEAGVPTASITYIDRQQVKCLGKTI